MKVTRYHEVRTGDAEATRIRDLLEELTRGQQSASTMALATRLNELRAQRDRLSARIIEGEAKLRATCAHPVFALAHQEHEMLGKRREIFEAVWCDVCACILFRRSRYSSPTLTTPGSGGS